MKTHDNTLYVTTQNAYIAKQGRNIAVRVEKKTRLCIPIHTLGSIVCFGRVGMSPFAMGLCGEANVGISFLTKYGRFLARVIGPQSGNVLLRRAQHDQTGCTKASSQTATIFISAKIANARIVLQRSLRDHQEKVHAPTLTATINRLGSLIKELQQGLPLEQIRGVEGEAARRYFQSFDQLIFSQKPDFHFRERTRRPPLDNTNSVLSFLYSLLTHDVRSACESVGLDPQMGFLHADRSGRPSLALDLMEELRPILADRLALSLINRRQISPSGFQRRENGGVEMSDKTRKTVITTYQKRKEETIQHPFLNEKITLGLLPHIQSRLLARWLRGDLDAYPAFFWR